MSPSRKSSVSSTISENAENECFQFVVKQLSKYQPLSVQQLIGHLSGMPSNLRPFVGKSNADLKKFLDSYPEIFTFNEKGKVYLADKSKLPKVKTRDSSVSSHTSNNSGTQVWNNSDTPNITDGRGHISRLFPTYGFITAISPINASVYFTSKCFGDKKTKILQDYCLQIGESVGFDAKRGYEQSSAEYRATRIWMLSQEEEEDTEEEKSSYKNIKTNNASHFRGRIFTDQKRERQKKFDEEQMNEAEPSLGFIQNLYEKYGFIETEKDSKRVFFHINHISDCHVSDLRELLKKGETVQFTAMPSTKKHDMWEATEVWVMKNALNKTPSSGEELYVSSPELSGEEDSDMGNTLHFGQNASFSEASCSRKANLKFTHSDSTNLYSVHGRIYPNTDTTALIKFGDSYKNVALAETCPFYMHERQVTDLMWEFNDNDCVQFDAILSDEDPDDPVWLAVLVWVGEKPTVVTSSSKSLPVAQVSDSTEIAKGNTTNNNGKNATTPEKKFSTYTNWGDSPFIDDPSQGKCENDNLSIDTQQHGGVNMKTSEIHSCSSENSAGDVSDSHSKSRELSGEENKKSLDHSKDANDSFLSDVINNHDLSDDEFAECLSGESASINPENNDATSCVDYMNPQDINTHAAVVSDNEKIQDRDPGVFMYQNLTGRVMKMYRYIAQISCKDLLRPASVLLNDMYYDGVLLKDKCTDPRELLKEGDIIYFNCFEIIDDDGGFWQKVTLAWKGDQPRKAKDSEPQEFIKKQNLKISCEIPTWKNFRKRMKGNESMRFLNTSNNPTISSNSKNSEGKFLSVVSAEHNKDSQDISSVYEQLESQVASDSALPALVSQLEGIKRRFSILCENSSSYDILQVIENVSLDIDAAIKLACGHSCMNTMSNGTCTLMDKSCQTDGLPAISHGLKQKEISQITASSCPTLSSGVQTFVTGDIIIRNIFPQ